MTISFEQEKTNDAPPKMQRAGRFSETPEAVIFGGSREESHLEVALVIQDYNVNLSFTLTLSQFPFFPPPSPARPATFAQHA